MQYYTTHSSEFYGDTIHALGHGDVWARELFNREPMSLEELQEQLIKYEMVTHVGVPHSYYGYGAPLAYLANSEHLNAYYSDACQTHSSLEHIVSREVVLEGEHDITSMFDLDYWEGTISLDDAATSQREYDAKMDFLFSEIRYELELEPEEIEELLQKLEINFSEWVDIDNDGYTVYALKGDLEKLFTMLKEAI